MSEYGDLKLTPYKPRKKKRKFSCKTLTRNLTFIFVLFISIPSFIYRLDRIPHIKNHIKIYDFIRDFLFPDIYNEEIDAGSEFKDPRIRAGGHSYPNNYEIGEDFSNYDNRYIPKDKKLKIRSGELRTRSIDEAHYISPDKQINSIMDNNKIVNGAPVLEIYETCDLGYFGKKCEYLLPENVFCMDKKKCSIQCTKNIDCQNSYGIYLHEELPLPETVFPDDYHIPGNLCDAECIDNECICQSVINISNDNLFF